MGLEEFLELEDEPKKSLRWKKKAPSKKKGTGPSKKKAPSKRTPNAYMLFLNKNHPHIKAGLVEAGVEANVFAVAKAAGAQWKQMSTEEKQPYIDEANKLKAEAKKKPTSKKKASKKFEKKKKSSKTKGIQSKK